MNSVKTTEFIDSTYRQPPIEMELVLNLLNEELFEYPKEFIRRVNSRVFELKFHKPNVYSIVAACIIEGDIYVVNLKGIIYIAGSMIDSTLLIEFGRYQFPAIQVTTEWMN